MLTGSSGSINRRIALAGAAAAAACLAALGYRYAIAAEDSQIFCGSVCRGTSTRLSVALTFDDGPSPGSLQVAQILAAAHVRATFFLCGANVLRHPEIAGRLHDAGHEVANHTFSHPRLCPRVGWQPNLLSAQTVYEEFRSAQEVIVRHSGAIPRLMRAPYGLRWFGMRAAQERLGLLGVHWSAIAHDWEWEPERVVNHLLQRVTPGAILCLHDGRDTRRDPDITCTLSALKLLIPQLQAMGYDFETVSDILLDRPR